MLNVGIVVHAIEQNHEFVAAHACCHIGLADMRADGIGRVHKDGVTGLVAVGIVDLFETIEVDVAQRQALAITFGTQQFLLGVGDEAVAVGQPGEAVVESQVAYFFFGHLAPLDLAAQAALTGQ